MIKILMVAMLAMLATLTPVSAAFAPNRIITAIDELAKTFSCQAKAGEPTYTYKTTHKTRIRISGKRVRVSYLWERGNFSIVKVGDIITVEYHLSGDDRIADRISIYSKK